MEERIKQANISWQDINTFLRNEKENYHFLDFVDIPWWWFFIPLWNFIAVFMVAYRIVAAPILLPVCKARRSNIIKNAYDIEDCGCFYKIIRGRNGKMGLCYWDTWLFNSLPLKTEYDFVERVNDTTFIVAESGVFGLYNADRGKFVIPITYRNISTISNDMVEVSDGIKIQKYNSLGERMYK